MPCSQPFYARLGFTVETFKEYFARRFQFQPVWSASAVYLIGQVVYYTPTSNYYVSLADANTALPTDTSKWQITASNAPYVWNEDIDNAYSEACMKFNADLFKGDDQIKIGYLYLTAHFLVQDLQNNGVGSSYSGPVKSRTVGNVSETLEVPKWLVNSPTFSFLGTTWYGIKYANMIWNRTRGTMKSVWTGTNPA